MTEQHAPRKRIVDFKIEQVRDLQIVFVHPAWMSVRNDDYIKARIAQETQTMFSTQRVARQMDGTEREIPHVLGLLRDFDILLVRQASDLDGFQVDHPDCENCVNSIEDLRQQVMFMPYRPEPVIAVCQFSFDQIVEAILEDPGA